MKYKSLMVIGALITLLSLLFYTVGSHFIFSDGYGYFHTAKSLVDNFSFASNVEPEYFAYSGHGVATLNDKYVSPYPIGTGILMSPFLLIAKTFDNSRPYSDYSNVFNGHSLEDGIAVSFSGIFYTVIGAFLLYQTMLLLGFQKKYAVLSILLVYLSSYILGYVIVNSAFSHSYEVFATSGFLYFLVKGRKIQDKNIIISGLFAGLNVLIRPVNLMILLPTAIYFIIKKETKKLLYFILGGFGPALIFFYYNYSSYGSVFSTGYASIGGQSLSLDNFNLFFLLFSTVRGWFVYSPTMILALLGLLIYGKKEKTNYLLFLMPVILTWTIFSFWENWWAGDSIGQRFFLNLIPFMSVGLAELFQKLKGGIKKATVGLSICLTFYSFATLILFRVSPTSALAENNLDTGKIYPQVTPAERITPADIYKYHLKNILESRNIVAYANKLKQSLSGGRSLLMLDLGLTVPLVRTEKIDDLSFLIHIVPSTNAKNFNSELSFSIKKESQVSSFVIKDINTSRLLSLQVNCQDICRVSYLDKQVESTDIIDKKENWLSVSKYLDITFVDNEELNFIDYKLKKQ